MESETGSARTSKLRLKPEEKKENELWRIKKLLMLSCPKQTELDSFNKRYGRSYMPDSDELSSSCDIFSIKKSHKNNQTVVDTNNVQSTDSTIYKFGDQ